MKLTIDAGCRTELKKYKGINCQKMIKLFHEILFYNADKLNNNKLYKICELHNVFKK